MTTRLLGLYFLAFLFVGCYEEREGCLDPDASNYDLLADVGCAECCTYPQLSLRVSSVWQDSALVAGQAYPDGAGNRFVLQRFRYYLGDLRLLTPSGELPVPLRPVDIVSLDGTDSTAVTINGNYLLASSTGVSTTTVGSLQTGSQSISGISGTYGLPDRFRNLVPGTAPATDALRTQPGLLNFRDGNGYVQARLEYALLNGPDTTLRSVLSYGSVPFELDFGVSVEPQRGADLRLDVEARLAELLGTIDLRADSTVIAEELGGAVDWLYPIGITQ